MRKDLKMFPSNKRSMGKTWRAVSRIVPLSILFALLASSSVLATCPVCIVAVAGGVELSRWLGVDDTISGIWIGGLVLSSAVWFATWLEKRRIKFRLMMIVVVVLFYLTLFLSLYWMELIGYSSCTKIWGVDKLLVGIVTGSVAFSLGIFASNQLKKRNKGKSYFSFQKVVVPILFLIVASILFYLITSC